MKVGELSRRLGVPRDKVRRLDGLGIIDPDFDGRYSEEDYRYAQRALEYEDIGFTLGEVQTIINLEKNIAKGSKMMIASGMKKLTAQKERLLIEKALIDLKLTELDRIMATAPISE